MHRFLYNNIRNGKTHLINGPKKYQKMNMNLDLEIDAIKSPCAQKQPSFTLPFCLLQLIKYCEIELENGLPLILDSDEVLELYGCKHK